MPKLKLPEEIANPISELLEMRTKIPTPRASAELCAALDEKYPKWLKAFKVADNNHEAFAYKRRAEAIADLSRIETFEIGREKLLNLEAERKTLKQIGWHARVLASSLSHDALIHVRQAYATEAKRFEEFIAEANAVHDRLKAFGLNAQPILEEIKASYAGLLDAKRRADEELSGDGYWGRNPAEIAAFLGYTFKGVVA